MPQSSATEQISIPVPTDEQRLGFNFREFAVKYGLDATKGGSAHMWREVWDETVSHIYRDVLSMFLSPFNVRWINSNNICLDREGRAEVWAPAEAGPLRGGEAYQKVHLVSIIAVILRGGSIVPFRSIRFRTNHI